MRIVLGSDHGGVELREELSRFVVNLGHQVTATVGPATAAESVDYPDVAIAACRKLLAGEADVVVLVCGTGQGMAMAANKLTGIRAGVIADPFSARMIRAHNDANVICFGQRVLGSELAKVLVQEYLSSSFEGGRHGKRVAKIEASIS